MLKSWTKVVKVVDAGRLICTKKERKFLAILQTLDQINIVHIIKKGSE